MSSNLIKRLPILLFAAIIVSCTASKPGSAENGGTVESKIQPSPLCDKSQYVIALDIGHTIKNPGAISARGIGEYFFNKKIVHMLFSELIRRGFEETFIINESGADIALIDRTAIAHSRKADVFLSIHHDSVQPQYLSKWFYQGDSLAYSDKFKGYSIFFSSINPEAEPSLAFARVIGEGLKEKGFTPTLHHAEKIKRESRELVDTTLGVYRFDGLAVLKTSRSPAVLLECGVLVNRNEELALTHPVVQRALVEAVSNAVEQFFKCL